MIVDLKVVERLLVAQHNRPDGTAPYFRVPGIKGQLSIARTQGQTFRVRKASVAPGLPSHSQ
jgi:hypothetical protein